MFKSNIILCIFLYFNKINICIADDDYDNIDYDNNIQYDLPPGSYEVDNFVAVSAKGNKHNIDVNITDRYEVAVEENDKKYGHTSLRQGTNGLNDHIEKNYHNKMAAQRDKSHVPNRKYDNKPYHAGANEINEPKGQNNRESSEFNDHRSRNNQDSYEHSQKLIHNGQQSSDLSEHKYKPTRRDDNFSYVRMHQSDGIIDIMAKENIQNKPVKAIDSYSSERKPHYELDKESEHFSYEKPHFKFARRDENELLERKHQTTVTQSISNEHSYHESYKHDEYSLDEERPHHILPKETEEVYFKQKSYVEVPILNDNDSYERKVQYKSNNTSKNISNDFDIRTRASRDRQDEKILEERTAQVTLDRPNEIVSYKKQPKNKPARLNDNYSYEQKSLNKPASLENNELHELNTHKENCRHKQKSRNFSAHTNKNVFNVKLIKPQDPHIDSFEHKSTYESTKQDTNEIKPHRESGNKKEYGYNEHKLHTPSTKSYKNEFYNIKRRYKTPPNVNVADESNTPNRYSELSNNTSAVLTQQFDHMERNAEDGEADVITIETFPNTAQYKHEDANVLPVSKTSGKTSDYVEIAAKHIESAAKHIESAAKHMESAAKRSDSDEESDQNNTDELVEYNDNNIHTELSEQKSIVPKKEKNRHHGKEMLDDRNENDVTFKLRTDKCKNNAGYCKRTLFNYPFAVSIQRKGAHYATGALLNKRFMVTAAAEFYNVRESLKLFRARLGSVNCKRGGTLVAIKSVEIHPHYVYKRPNLDVALLKTAMNIIFTEFTKPISLSTTRTKVLSAKFMTVYWPRVIVQGHLLPKTANERNHSSSLRVSIQRLIPSAECSVIMRSHNTSLEEPSLCLKPIKAGHSSCTPDPGAPLIAEDGLWGVLSGWSSEDCLSRPSPNVFTRLSSQPIASWLVRQLRIS